MARLFELSYPAPLAVRVQSRQSCTYLYRLMTLLGWIPPEQGWQRYLYLFYSSTVIMVFVYLPTALGLSMLFNARSLTLGEFLRTLLIFFNIGGAVIKYLTTLYYLRRLHDTRLALDTLDEEVKSESDRRRIHKAVADSNNVFLIYGKLYLTYTISDIISGIMNNRPPWLMYNPLFDWRCGVFQLLVQFSVEIVVMVVTTLAFVIVDTYTLIFVNVLRGHIDVLKDHISELRQDPAKTEAENHKDLVSCVTYHQLIIYCCQLLRPVLSITLFIQFLLIGIVLGLTFINILYFSSLLRGLSSVIFLGTVLIQTFPFCYQCDLLAADCTDLANFLAQSNWIDAEAEYKSTLKIFLFHVQRPITFVAGAFFPISLTTGIKMAKFAFTVVTIVQQMNLADSFR